MTELRTTAQRKRDILAALKGNGDVWLATAGRSGRPHLIAVSAWWTGELLVIATTAESRTARNLAETRAARVAVGAPSDAVIVDTELVDAVPAATADPALSAGFEKAVGWNPAHEGPAWTFFRLRPVRVQAYRGYGELEGRDVMREGAWLA